MKNRMKSAYSNSVRFVKRNKTKLADAGTAAIGLYLLSSQGRTFNAFLKENGLTQQFNTWIVESK